MNSALRRSRVASTALAVAVLGSLATTPAIASPDAVPADSEPTALVVDTTAPDVVITSPVDGGFVRPGDPVTFSATIADANPWIHYAQLDGIGIDYAWGSPLTSYATTVDSTGWADGSVHTFRFAARDAVDQSDAGSSASVKVTADASRPVVTITAPASNTAHSGVVTVSGTATDSGSGVASLDLRVRAANAAGVCDGPTERFPVAFGADGAWSYDLDSSLVADGTYCLIVHAVDGVGNGNGQSTRLRGIEVDNTVPTVVDEAQRFEDEQGGRVAVTLTFSEPLLPGSLGQGWYGSGVEYTKVYYRSKTVTIGFADLVGNPGSAEIDVVLAPPIEAPAAIPPTGTPQTAGFSDGADPAPTEPTPGVPGSGIPGAGVVDQQLETFSISGDVASADTTAAGAPEGEPKSTPVSAVSKAGAEPWWLVLIAVLLALAAGAVAWRILRHRAA